MVDLDRQYNFHVIAQEGAVRPKPTLTLWPESGGYALGSCRSSSDDGQWFSPSARDGIGPITVRYLSPNRSHPQTSFCKLSCYKADIDHLTQSALRGRVFQCLLRTHV